MVSRHLKPDDYDESLRQTSNVPNSGENHAAPKPPLTPQTFWNDTKKGFQATTAAINQANELYEGPLPPTVTFTKAETELKAGDSILTQTDKTIEKLREEAGNNDKDELHAIYIFRRDHGGALPTGWLSKEREYKHVYNWESQRRRMIWDQNNEEFFEKFRNIPEGGRWYANNYKHLVYYWVVGNWYNGKELMGPKSPVYPPLLDSSGQPQIKVIEDGVTKTRKYHYIDPNFLRATFGALWTATGLPDAEELKTDIIIIIAVVGTVAIAGGLGYAYLSAPRTYVNK